MSEAVLTVPTAFADISQLSEGLADRVDEERIMLYGPAPVEDGQWVRFAVTLADGSAAIEGLGRAVASIDGGEERPEVARYDIVLDSIQFEGMSEVVYERIMMVRSQAFADQPATGEVSLDDVEQIEEEQAAAAEGFSDEATAVGGPDYEAEAQAAAHEAPDEGLSDEAEAAAFAVEPDAAAHPEYEAEPVHAPVDQYADDATAVSPEAEAAAYGEEAPAAQTDPLVPAPDEEAAHVDYAAEGPAEQTSPEEWEQVQDDGAYAVEGPDEVAEVSSEEAYGEPEAQEPGPSAPVPPSAPPPAPPTEPAGFHVEPMGSNGAVLHRPSRQQAWFPDAVAELEASPSSGLFLYSGGLPVPAEPPRPDLDASLRISPAPRPADASADEGPAAGEAAPYETPEADYGGATDEVDASEAMAHDAEAELSAPDPSFAHTDQDMTAPDQVAPLDEGLDDLGEVDLGADVEALPDSVPPGADFEDFDDPES